ncbi:MAG: hypothetical protein A2Z91_06730 [Deltaproteobacteria bacterium GWA2_38_16]|nr:MAG: hypothetical protein A2Z91_06730 [Deltaproteobacteria bacterium GWA2_38_16]OGQ03396.1 MAG: hypothetical protein A3D19_04680 [Deltaproteobacteria bacterium RIFCSPHIGHO2_02_FULL_38_15]OGQ34721.1 MAG: hypothetical protein A3A72_07455 [Deltaproteobacteria bacterium RIFCSPLOWO2_01_FULL_38_9]OGQ61929.1 MAG: hypothetical protein A3G92_04855 [Deltaproteobacteria bacterium RIFCSPLOWO2_12_FULL_38_8]HBQ20673.1 hypothetical protein [Deltaproteobacteria bacterium]
MYKIAFWALTYGILVGGCFTLFAWFAQTNDTFKTWYYKLAPIQTLVGIFCFVGGILGLFYPIGEEMITGDLIPAVIAILLGFMYIFAYFKQPAFLNQIYQKLTPYQVPFGIIAIGAALVHYFIWGTKTYF